MAWWRLDSWGAGRARHKEEKWGEEPSLAITAMFCSEFAYVFWLSVSMRKVAGEHPFYMNSYIFHNYFILFILLSYLIFDFVCLTLSLADTHGIAKYACAYIRRYTHTRTHTKRQGGKSRKSRTKQEEKEERNKQKRGGCQERKKEKKREKTKRKEPKKGGGKRKKGERKIRSYTPQYPRSSTSLKPPPPSLSFSFSPFLFFLISLFFLLFLFPLPTPFCYFFGCF